MICILSIPHDIFIMTINKITNSLKSSTKGPKGPKGSHPTQKILFGGGSGI